MGSGTLSNDTKTNYATSDLIQVDVIPSAEYSLKGISNKMNVLFNIKTSEVEELTRPPINLAIVLDRSGSMASKDKMQNSKKAIKQVIENLSPKDLIHLIAYDGKTEVVFEGQTNLDIESLLTAVDRVTCRGSTNLCAGVELGAQKVAQYNQTGYTQRIFLFSDGKVNSGIQDRDEIYNVIQQKIYDEMDIKVSSFGVGSDFDETLMKEISEVGSGAYFFIENSEDITKFVTEALGSLLSQVSTNTNLKIRGSNGGVLNKIFGHQDLIKGANLGDLRQSNLRQILTQFTVTPTNSNIIKEEILTWELKFKSSYDEIADSEYSTLTGNLNIKYTEDESLIVENNEVNVAFAIQESSERDTEISKFLEKNKTKEAISVQETQIQCLDKFLAFDDTGMLSNLKKQALITYEKLKTEGNSIQAKKQVHHQKYMKQRGCAQYIDGYCG